MDSISEVFIEAHKCEKAAVYEKKRGRERLTPDGWEVRAVVCALEAHARVVSQSLASLEETVQKGLLDIASNIWERKES